MAARRAIASTNEGAGASGEPSARRTPELGPAAAKVLAGLKQLTGGLPHTQPLAIYSCASTHCSPGHSHRHGLNINLNENTVGEEI